MPQEAFSVVTFLNRCDLSSPALQPKLLSSLSLHISWLQGLPFPLVLTNTAWLHSHILPGYGCRDPFPSPLLSVCHPSKPSPPVAPFSYHFKHMLHRLAFTVHLHSPAPSSVIQLGKVGSHLQLAPGASPPSPTSSIFKQVILVFIPHCSSCSLKHLQGYLITLPQNTS